jgi:hypothetical protein
MVRGRRQGVEDAGDRGHAAVAFAVGGEQRWTVRFRDLLHGDRLGAAAGGEAGLGGGTQVEGPVAETAVGDEVALALVVQDGHRDRALATGAAAFDGEAGDHRPLEQRDQPVGYVALHPGRLQIDAGGHNSHDRVTPRFW